MDTKQYPVNYLQKFFESDREMRDAYIGGINTRPGSDSENVAAANRRQSLAYDLRMNMPSIPNGGESLVDDEPADVKMRYLSSRDLNVYKTHLTEPARIANSDEEYYLRTRPVSSRPRDLPRIDDRFTLVNFSTRDLPTGKQNMIPEFDKYTSLVERHKGLPNIDTVSYEAIKLSHVPFDASKYVSSDSWTRGGRDSRQ